MKKKKLKKYFMDLHLALKYDDDNNGDINGNELYEEIKVCSETFSLKAYVIGQH